MSLLILSPSLRKRLPSWSRLSVMRKSGQRENFLTKTTCLGPNEWDAWGVDIMEAVRDLAAQLPDLDGCVVTFPEGARATFSEVFTVEFKEGGHIDKMRAAERETLLLIEKRRQKRCIEQMAT
jgi:hypothetical protein